MKRLALLGTAVLGLTIGAAACGGGPVEPGTSTAAYDLDPSLGRKGPSTPTVTTTNCADVVYPSSLCLPTYRPALCAALRIGGTMNEPVVGREAKQEFTRTESGSLEVLSIPREYYSPIVFTFRITTAQIESDGMCKGVATA